MLLLADARRRLLLLWLIVAALLLLFFLLQSLNGKYTGMEAQAWTWIFVKLLPGLGLLLAAALQPMTRRKFLPVAIFWAAAGLVSLYLVFVLSALVGISSGAAGESLEVGFAGAYRYLLPLQGLALAVLGALFFTGGALFQPKEAALRDHAQRLLRQAGADQPDRRYALECFVHADLPAMLDFLEEKLRARQVPALNDVLLLKNRLANYQRSATLGLLSSEEARKEYGLIGYAALGLVEEM